MAICKLMSKYKILANFEVQAVWKSKKLIQKSKKKSKNKNIPIIVSFDGFPYQSIVTQATATIPSFSVIFIRLKSMVKSSVQLNSVV